MKKGYNPSDIPQQEGQDQAKRLYRSISDNARRLDEVRGCARAITELFTPSLLAQRNRLRENCEKLIFLDPILYGRKGEELLWRKVYYDVVSTSKRLKKQEYSLEDVAHLQYHISSGIGYYHHFIARLQLEFNLNLLGIVDFPVTINNKLAKLNETDSLTKWVEQSVHQCLIYLGDLSRYKLEIYPNWDHGLATRYYLQALNYKPEFGMPHNQLGTLSSSFNNNLDATYHYMRCLCSDRIFEGTENNLLRLLEKNSNFVKNSMTDTNDFVLEPNECIKKFISQFLLLVEVMYFDKKNGNIHGLCHQVLIDLKTCLRYTTLLASESGGSSLNLEACENDSITYPSYLNADVILKIVVVCLMCIIKLQRTDSKNLSTMKAFLLAVYSHLTQNIIEHIQGSVFNISLPSPLPENQQNGKHKKKNKLLRRRRIKTDNDDSDVSDELDSDSNESINSMQSNSDVESIASCSESEVSDNEQCTTTDLVLNGHSSEVNGKSEGEENKITETEQENINNESVRKVKRLDPNDLLEIVADEGFLQSIKILCDWIMGEIHVLKECGNSSLLLLKQIVQLLNLINIDSSHRKIKNVKLNLFAIQKDFEKIPLPEDVILKGVPVLKKVQDKIDWNYLKDYLIEPKEEALFRISKLIAFGWFLTEIPDTGISFNKSKKCFVIENVVPKEPKQAEQPETPELEVQAESQKNESFSRGKLMKHMGQLWLAAEIQDLESRVQCRTAFSPYLVLDVEALINYMFLVKQLVSARKFIVLVPIVVLSALDELKHETRAREAIRWLETQFHRGNRFLRSQRLQERSSVPLIKYPKKKDKETHMFIQIIECCYFLTQQQKGATNLVTLLVGNSLTITSSEAREISYVGLAQSAGVNIELITGFVTKWRKSMKGGKTLMISS